MLENFYRLGHDCFRIEGEQVVYTDPYHLQGEHKPADIVLISHEHYDHCSIEDITKVCQPNTQLLAIAACRQMLENVGGKLTIVKPGDNVEINGVSIEVVPAYNTDKDFHPKAKGHVGYIFTLQDQRIYFAGDTDHILEMKDFRVDIALLPVSGTYVMTAEEAVAAANDMRPKVVIPMHYDDIVGSAEDATRFASLYSGKTVIK